MESPAIRGQSPSKIMNNLYDLFREYGIKAYDDQRDICVKVLADEAGIQCYDHETLGELVEALQSNIDDGTVPFDIFLSYLA